MIYCSSNTSSMGHQITSSNCDDAGLVDLEHTEKDLVSEIVDKVFSRLIAQQKLPQPGQVLKRPGRSLRPYNSSRSVVNNVPSEQHESLANTSNSSRPTVATVSCRQFGPIPGIAVGSWWFKLNEVRVIHRTPKMCINGSATTGAYSILLSSLGSRGRDNGEEISFCPGDYVKLAHLNQNSLRGRVRALALNCNAKLNGISGNKSADWRKGKPVRLIRSFELKSTSAYAPMDGYRYDGIYKITQYRRVFVNDCYHIWLFTLRRDDESPAPWNLARKMTSLDHNYYIVSNYFTEKKEQSNLQEEVICEYISPEDIAENESFKNSKLVEKPDFKSTSSGSFEKEIQSQRQKTSVDHYSNPDCSNTQKVKLKRPENIKDGYILPEVFTENGSDNKLKQKRGFTRIMSCNSKKKAQLDRRKPADHSQSITERSAVKEALSKQDRIESEYILPDDIAEKELIMNDQSIEKALDASNSFTNHSAENERESKRREEILNEYILPEYFPEHESIMNDKLVGKSALESVPSSSFEEKARLQQQKVKDYSHFPGDYYSKKELRSEKQVKMINKHILLRCLSENESVMNDNSIEKPNFELISKDKSADEKERSKLKSIVTNSHTILDNELKSANSVSEFNHHFSIMKFWAEKKTQPNRLKVIKDSRVSEDCIEKKLITDNNSIEKPGLREPVEHKKLTERERENAHPEDPSVKSILPVAKPLPISVDTSRESNQPDVYNSVLTKESNFKEKSTEISHQFQPVVLLPKLPIVVQCKLPIVLLPKLPIDQNGNFMECNRIRNVPSVEREVTDCSTPSQGQLDATKSSQMAAKQSRRLQSVCGSQAGQLPSDVACCVTYDESFCVSDSPETAAAPVPYSNRLQSNENISEQLCNSISENKESNDAIAPGPEKLPVLSSLEKLHVLEPDYNSQNGNAPRKELHIRPLSNSFKSYSIVNERILDPNLRPPSLAVIPKFQDVSMPVSKEFSNTLTSVTCTRESSTTSAGDSMSSNILHRSIVTLRPEMNSLSTSVLDSGNEIAAFDTPFVSVKMEVDDDGYTEDVFEDENIRSEVSAIDQELASYRELSSHSQPTVVKAARENTNPPKTKLDLLDLVRWMKKDKLNRSTWDYLRQFSRNEPVFLKNAEIAFTCPSCDKLATVTMLCQHNACVKCLGTRFLKKMRTCPYLQCGEIVRTVVYRNSRGHIVVRENVILKNILKKIFPHKF